MKISERATEEQERVSPRTFSARSFGYTCLILISLAARDAVAQGGITVTLPLGVITQPVVVPTSQNFSVTYISSEQYVCNLPTAAQANTMLQSLAGFGRLQQVLTAMESAGTASAVSIGSAYQALFGSIMGKTGNVFSSGIANFSQSRLLVGPYTHTFASDCLTVPEARAGINDIRRIIRAHLGLLAPTN